LTGHNVIAKPKGIADCSSVTGGHYDSVPVTGGATIIRLARHPGSKWRRVAAGIAWRGANCFARSAVRSSVSSAARRSSNALPARSTQQVRVMINLTFVGVSGALG